MLDGGELAIEERALGRGGDRRQVAARAPRRACPASAALRAFSMFCWTPRNLSTSTRPRSDGQRRIRRERGLEGVGRRVGAPLREQRLPFARERRSVGGVARQRAIEVRQRRLPRPCGRARHSPGRLRRDRTPGVCFEDGREVAFGGLGVARLEHLPRRLMLGRRPRRREVGRRGRKDVVGEPRRAGGHRRDDRLLARTPASSTRTMAIAIRLARVRLSGYGETPPLAPDGDGRRDGEPPFGSARAGAWAARLRR